MQSAAQTVDEYLTSLPADRRQAVAAVRDVILKNLPPGYRESMQYGMLGYAIPLERFPRTYNGQPLAIAALASQKGHLSLYLMGVYGDEQVLARFRAGFAKAGKKLDMGKSCVRFKSADELALDAIGDAIRAVTVETFIAAHDRWHPPKGAKAAKAVVAKKKPAKKAAKPAAKKPAKKPTAKKPAAKKPAKQPAAKKGSGARR